MKPERFFAMVFDSTHHAIKVERKLKETLPVEMIPTPRSITASCGLSLKITPRDLPEAVRRLQALAGDRDRIRIYDMGEARPWTPREIDWRRKEEDDGND